MKTFFFSILFVVGIQLNAQQQFDALPVGSAERVVSYFRDVQGIEVDPLDGQADKPWMKIFAPDVVGVQYLHYFNGEFTPNSTFDNGGAPIPNGAPSWCWLSELVDDYIYLPARKMTGFDLRELTKAYGAPIDLHIVLYYSEDLSEYDKFDVLADGKRIESTRDIRVVPSVGDEPKISLTFQDGHPVVTISGEAGDNVVIESSTNLQDWTLVESSQVQLSSAGVAKITDRTATEAMRFYRVVRLTPSQ